MKWNKACLVCLLVTLTLTNEIGALMCYSCPKTYNPEECEVKVPCRPNQVCSVQEVSAPHNEIYFWSGCEDIEVCGTLSEAAFGVIIGKRQDSALTDRCLYCCSTDLCNVNCSSFVNLALHRPAYQSSVGFNGTADKAVDGDTSKNYYTGHSCMHTGVEPYPWWAVDLGRDYHITKIKLHNRDDAGADDRRFHLKFLVSSENATLLDRNSSDFQLCGTYFGHSSDGNTIVVDCPRDTVGRWLRIQEDNPVYEYLHFCEVEVLGF